MPVPLNYIYGATSFDGGAGSLRAIDGAKLNDKDCAMVFVKGGLIYHYVLDEYSGATPSTPDVVDPASTAGDKRWILHRVYNTAVEFDQSLNTNDDVVFNTIDVEDDAVTRGHLGLGSAATVDIGGGPGDAIVLVDGGDGTGILPPLDATLLTGVATRSEVILLAFIYG